MVTALEALEEIRKVVQHNRENGESDLRSVLHSIEALKQDIKAGKSLQEIRKERANEES